MKNLNLAKIILIVVILIGICSMFYFAFNETIFSINERIIKNQENNIQIREENIKEIAQIYKDKFQTIGKSESAYIIEHEENVNGVDIRRDYYVFGEEEKSLIKVKEYEGTNENGTPILAKEIYIDLSKKVENSENLYNEVTEINVKDWTSNVIDNYKFKTPIEKFSEILNNRYDFENNPEEIALDLRNEIYVQKMLDNKLRIYGWGYEIKDKLQDEYLSFGIGGNEIYLNLDFQKYENNKLIEKITMQVAKQKGSIDDVTVPKL